MRRVGALLLSPPFLIALTLLVVNDALLKSRWPGFVTGKLSDFAGLFAFVVFARAVLPRYPKAIGVITALAFIWWKSPASHLAIDAWNRLGIIQVGRVVDVRDLVALTIVPLALVWAAARERDATRVSNRVATVAIGVASLAAFAATSVEHGTCCAASYDIPMDRANVVVALKNVAKDVDCPGDNACSLKFPSTGICGRKDAEADITLAPYGDHTWLHVETLVYWCDHADAYDVAAQRAFKESVIVPLRGRRMAD